jgi:hypothetical protein
MFSAFAKKHRGLRCFLSLVFQGSATTHCGFGAANPWRSL